MTSEMLATIAKKCHTMRRRRMQSKDNSSCTRMQAGNFSKLPQSGGGMKWISGQSEDCPLDCMGYLYY
jgi:hypothetical protein